MEQYVEMMSAASVVVYIFIGLIFLVFVIWGWRIIKGRGKKPVDTSLPVEDVADSVKANDGEKPADASKTHLHKGEFKCLCFHKIRGVNVADFTTIDKPIGELYQFSPSCPFSGSGYIVKEDGHGDITDYDPREIPYILKESPEYAWFAIGWDIVKSVYFAPVLWWKSTSVWFAAAMIAVTFIVSLAYFG